MMNELIDKIATKEKVRELLSNYRRWARISGEIPDGLSSPQYSNMPKSDSKPSYPSKQTVKYIDADIKKKEIDQALLRLSLVSSEILKLSYCVPEIRTNYDIAVLWDWSISKFEGRKSQSLLEFAEAYNFGELEKYFENKDF